MAIAASILSPSEGENFDFPGLFSIRTRVTREQTGGTFELYDLRIGVAAVDYHVHHLMDETLCVVEGEIEFTVEGKKFVRQAGSVAFVPRGVHHGFRNLGPARARVLIVFNPPTGQADFFRQLRPLVTASPVDVAAVQALQKQFDQELIQPNLVTAG